MNLSLKWLWFIQFEKRILYTINFVYLNFMGKENNFLKHRQMFLKRSQLVLFGRQFSWCNKATTSKYVKTRNLLNLNQNHE